MNETGEIERSDVRRARRDYYLALLQYASVCHMDAFGERAPTSVLEELEMTARLEAVNYEERRSRRRRRLRSTT